MNKIAPITFKFAYLDQNESEDLLQTAYGRIFALARQRIIDRNSTLESASQAENKKK